MSIKLSVAVLGFAVVLSVSGCATTTIGSVPDKNPPQLVKSDKSNSRSDNERGLNQGKPDNVRWDRPAAFGPVPSNLKAVGDAACKSSGFAKATGYHPTALGVDGKPMVGGGYYCSR